jgi:cytochrome c oxidase subunit 2
MNELFRRLLMLPPQASTVARGIDVLHYVVITISMLGAAAVAATVALFLVKFRARPGVTPHPRARRIPVWAETAGVACLLAMFLAFWVVGFRQFVELQTPPKHAIDVYVVAKQWMWEFAYPQGAATTGDLYVPAGRPVRLILTSRDVIHSFYVPDFRVKQDVLPGRSTFLWFEATEPGVHDILCAEYCGTEHSRMRGRVIALDAGDWSRWAEDRPGERQDLATAGGKLAAQRGCLRCHTVDGTPHLGPTWAGLYGARIDLASGERVRVDVAYLTESMMDPERRLRAGFSAIMPSYRGLLDASEVAALVEYIRALPGPTSATSATSATSPTGATSATSGAASPSPLPVAPMPAQPITPPPARQP